MKMHGININQIQPKIWEIWQKSCVWKPGKNVEEYDPFFTFDNQAQENNPSKEAINKP